MPANVLVWQTSENTIPVSPHIYAKKPPSADAAIKQLAAAAKEEVSSCWMFAGCCILCLWQCTKWTTETQQAFLACGHTMKWSYKLGCSQLFFSCQVSREEISQPAICFVLPIATLSD